MTPYPADVVGRLLARQEVRFALVGVVNTAFGYGIFVLLEVLAGHVLPYVIVLLISYVVGVSEAFVLQRRVVFRHQGPWLPAYLRFWSVYLVSLGVNVLLLPVLVELAGLPVALAQLLILALVVAGSFVAHRRYSFRPVGTSTLD